MAPARRDGDAADPDDDARAGGRREFGMVATVRDAFAHDAVVAMDGDADVAAPGAAITAALCGHWEHDGPCPLAPHHTAAGREGGMVRLRILFAAEATDEAEVRRRIDDALAREEVEGPDGTITRWRIVASTPGGIQPDEAGHAARLRT